MKNNTDLPGFIKEDVTPKNTSIFPVQESGINADIGVFPAGSTNSYATQTGHTNAIETGSPKITILLGDQNEKKDQEIAGLILRNLEKNWQVPNYKIKIKVEGGYVTLEGELHWHYEMDALLVSLDGVPAIKGIVNNIKII